MTMIYIVIGALVGAILGASGGLAVVGGAIVGWLLARLSEHDSQVRNQQTQLDRLEQLLTQQRANEPRQRVEPAVAAKSTHALWPNTLSDVDAGSAHAADYLADSVSVAMSDPDVTTGRSGPVPTVAGSEPGSVDARDGSGAVSYGRAVFTSLEPQAPTSLEPGRTSAPIKDALTADTEESSPPAQPYRHQTPPVQAVPRAPAVPRWRPDHVDATGLPNADQDASALGAWLQRANWPVVLGGLMLFIGIGALLKYAADAGWFSFPIWMRLLAIAAAALASLVFGFAQRDSRPGFAVATQGVSLGVLLMTIYAALRLYGLLEPSMALSLMVAVVALGIVLAVLQDAMVLAVLSAVGGFAAPVLASTGSGNPIALYAYLAVLNLGILVVALRKRWALLHRVGLIGTFVLSAAWGYRYYSPLWRTTVEPFLLSFLLLYIMVAILAVRRGGDDGDGFDASVVFGAPFATALLLNSMWPEEDLLAVHAALGGLGYAALWFWLRAGARYRLLADSFGALGLLFLTLAIPLAFEARLTSALFAVEGALLIWVAARNGKQWPQWAGIVLQLAAGFAWLDALRTAGSPELDAPGQTLGGLLLAASAWFSGWLFLHRMRDAGPAMLATIVSVFWLVLACVVQLDHWFAASAFAHAGIALCATVLLLYTALARWLPASLMVARVAVCLTPLLLWLAAIGYPEAVLGSSYLLAGMVAIMVIAIHNLASQRADWPQPGLVSCVFWLVVMVWVSLVLHALLDQHISRMSGWFHLYSALPWLLFALLARKPHQVLCWPFGSRAHDWYGAFVLMAAAGLIWLLARSLFVLGSEHGPHIPILNPLEAMQLLACYSLYVLHRDSSQVPEESRGLVRMGLLGVLGLMYSVAAVRAVAHWFGLVWDGSILQTPYAQSALSLAWSVLGVGLMILGHRRHQRASWIAGAALMTFVALKLLVVDQDYLGTLAGISAFIGTGLLLAVVGYFAPLPPAEEARE